MDSTTLRTVLERPGFGADGPETIHQSRARLVQTALTPPGHLGARSGQMRNGLTQVADKGNRPSFPLNGGSLLNDNSTMGVSGAGIQRRGGRGASAPGADAQSVAIRLCECCQNGYQPHAGQRTCRSSEALLWAHTALQELQ